MGVVSYTISATVKHVLGLLLLALASTWHMGERNGLLSYSHIHRRGSLAPLPIPAPVCWQRSEPIVPCTAADEDRRHLLHSHDHVTSSFACHILQRTRWEGQLSLSQATTWQTKWGVLSSQALTPSRLAYLCSCQDARFYCASGEGLEVLLPVRDGILPLS